MGNFNYKYDMKLKDGTPLSKEQVETIEQKLKTVFSKLKLVVLFGVFIALFLGIASICYELLFKTFFSSMAVSLILSEIYLIVSLIAKGYDFNGYCKGIGFELKQYYKK